MRRTLCIFQPHAFTIIHLSSNVHARYNYLSLPFVACVAISRPYTQFLRATQGL